MWGALTDRRVSHYWEESGQLWLSLCGLGYPDGEIEETAWVHERRDRRACRVCDRRFKREVAA